MRYGLRVRRVKSLVWRKDMTSRRPHEGWLHGEVDTFDSHQQGWSGMRKSQIVVAPT